MARDYNSSYYDYIEYPSLTTHFVVFIGITFLFLIFNWYMNFESKFEDLMDHLKLCFIVCLVILLLVIHWLSINDPRRGLFYLTSPEKDSAHRVGGSPVGVALVLLLLMLMISHHSSFRERWFPLFSRK